MPDATATFGYDGTLLNAGLRQQESNIQASANRSEKTFAKLSGAIKGYFSFQAIKGIGSAVMGQLGSAGDLIDITERLNVSAEEFQRVDFMAKKKGSNAETIIKALEKLNSALAEVDNEKAASAFSELGIDPAEMARLSPQQQIYALSQAFQEAQESGTGYAEIFDLLGKSAGELLPLLRTSREELMEFASQPVVSEAHIRMMDGLDDKIETATDGLMKMAKEQLAAKTISDEERAAIEKKIDLLEKQRQKQRDATAEEIRKKQAVEQSTDAEKAASKVANESKTTAKKDASKMQGQLDTAMEVKRLKALAAGRKKAAEEIEREGQVMQRIMQLVQQDGMDPAEAEKLARQMQGWQDKADGRRRKVRGYSSKQGGRMMGGSVDDYNRLQAIELSGPNEGRYKYSGTYMGPSRSTPSRMMGSGLDEFHARNGTRGAAAAGFTSTSGVAYNSTAAQQAQGRQQQQRGTAASVAAADAPALLRAILDVLKNGLG